VHDYGLPHLVIPRWTTTICGLLPTRGLILAIFAYLRDAFDVLYAEGETAPKMMSVGLLAA